MKPKEATALPPIVPSPEQMAETSQSSWLHRQRTLKDATCYSLSILENDGKSLSLKIGSRKMTIPTGKPGRDIKIPMYDFNFEVSFEEEVDTLDKWRSYIIDQQLAKRENHLRKCLARWVSELEPCAKIDINHNLIGLGIEGYNEIFVLNEELYRWVK